MTENMEEIDVNIFRKEVGEDLFLKNTNYYKQKTRLSFDYRVWG